MCTCPARNHAGRGAHGNQRLVALRAGAAAASTQRGEKRAAVAPRQLFSNAQAHEPQVAAQHCRLVAYVRAEAPDCIPQVQHERQAAQPARELGEARLAACGKDDELNGAVEQRVLKRAAAGQAAGLRQAAAALAVGLCQRRAEDAVEHPERRSVLQG